jgi:hypothetical protein
MSQTTPSTGPGIPQEPETSGHAAVPAPPEPAAAGRRRPATLIVALAVAVAVIAALVAALVWSSDGDDTTTEPTTTEAPTSAPTTAPTTTAATAPTATTVTPAPEPAPGAVATAVFPDPSTARRFDDPVAAARAFAVEFAGFTDPLLGEFMQGDARSGEVEVRPTANGPATTVIVRQLDADGAWWVVGSTTRDITLDTPAAGDTIQSPVTLTGSAHTFEGHVSVEVRRDGVLEPIGSGFVTGGGDMVRPFSGDVAFTGAAPGDLGALVLLTEGAEDGRVWQAVVIRVAFG